MCISRGYVYKSRAKRNNLLAYDPCWRVYFTQWTECHLRGEGGCAWGLSCSEKEL